MRQINYNKPFHRSGLAALSDLQTPEWKELFQLLEKEQQFFLSKEKLFRSAEYKWPRDPLHTWSRVWEYPYVYYHLKEWRKKEKCAHLPVVVDFGSGVTFFPFAVAKLGYHVICIDNDPICERDMQQAISVVPHSPGKVEFCLNRGMSIPLQDNYADIIYSISVLEHIPGFPEVIAEMARVLKDNGVLILTVDLDLGGHSEMRVERFYLLKNELWRHFFYIYPETTIHPADLLKSDSGPHGLKKPNGIKFLKFILKQRVIKPLLRMKPEPMIPFYLSVFGCVMSRCG